MVATKVDPAPESVALSPAPAKAAVVAPAVVCCVAVFVLLLSVPHAPATSASVSTAAPTSGNDRFTHPPQGTSTSREERTEGRRRPVGRNVNGRQTNREGCRSGPPAPLSS